MINSIKTTFLKSTLKKMIAEKERMTQMFDKQEYIAFHNYYKGEKETAELILEVIEMLDETED